MVLSAYYGKEIPKRNVRIFPFLFWFKIPTALRESAKVIFDAVSGLSTIKM